MEALSYMWGPEGDFRDLLLGGTLVRVRKNLADALEALRSSHFDGARALWVDAICINQDDIPERSSQVSKMSKIYRSAERVIVWLGEANNGSDFFLESLSRMKGNPKLFQQITEQQKATVLHILNRPYWRRVWIIQEIMSGKEISSHCGSKFIDSQCWWAFQQLVGSSDLRQSPGAAIILQRQLLSRDHLNNPHSYQKVALSELLQLCLGCESESLDIRDRIYGLVSLIEGVTKYWSGGHYPYLRPDYNKTTASLYVDAFLYYVATGDGDTDIKMSQTSSPFDDKTWNSIRALDKLLDRPIWSKDDLHFHSLRSICEYEQERLIVATRCLVGFSRIGELAAVGLARKDHLWAPFDPEIFTSESLKQTVELVQQNKALQHWVSGLNRGILHCTQLIGSEFCPDERLSREDYCLDDGYDPNVFLDIRSSGDWRFFRVSGNQFGIASADVMKGDVLCKVIGPARLYIIIRRQTKQLKGRLPKDGFKLIGRAFVKETFEEGEELLQPSQGISGREDVTVCRMDAVSLFLLTR